MLRDDVLEHAVHHLQMQVAVGLTKTVNHKRPPMPCVGSYPGEKQMLADTWHAHCLHAQSCCSSEALSAQKSSGCSCLS